MLKLANGTETQDMSTILNEMHDFYAKLYKSGEEWRTSGWEKEIINITRLSDAEQMELEGEISYEELTEAVKSTKNGKSPGSDGFPVEFFQIYWKCFGALFLRCANECYRDGEYSAVQAGFYNLLTQT